MATTFTLTTPTFSTPIALASFATSTTPNAKTRIDLRNSLRGMFLHCFIGRNAATALTRSARIAIRRTINTTRRGPDNYDFVSSIAAVNVTTVSSGGASGAGTMVLASGTGFAADQWCCAQLAGARGEFFRICNLTTATITNDHPDGFLTTHNASDVVTNGVDQGTVYIPPGDQYDIWFINNSGQTLIALCEAELDASDTGT